jgi:hypothetical protein
MFIKNDLIRRRTEDNSGETVRVLENQFLGKSDDGASRSIKVSTSKNNSGVTYVDAGDYELLE